LLRVKNTARVKDKGGDFFECFSQKNTTPLTHRLNYNVVRGLGNALFPKPLNYAFIYFMSCPSKCW